jgi:serine/threonine-protein kinase ATR
MFLLPYLVEAVLLIGHEEEYQEILNEISVVLAHVDSTGEGADANEANVHPVAQTIFRVVDTLSEWTIGAADSATAVTRLLEAIPRYTLARASYRCDAHARALMYLEMHLAGRKAEATRGELSFLQALPRPARPALTRSSLPKF